MPDNPMDFSYKKKTPKEVAEEVKEAKALALKIKTVVKTIENCFGSSEFTRYKEAYKAYRESAIKTLIGLQEVDPIKFTITAKTLLREIEVLGFLMDKVKEDNAHLKRRKRKEG